MRLPRPVYVASGRKWVSVAGLVLVIAGAVCAELDGHLSQRGIRWCNVVAVAGGIVASLGRGVADRRKPTMRKGWPDVDVG